MNLAEHSEKQSSQLMHLTFFEMALDYLLIQASAVPSEQVFSSSAETDTKKHNHINPVLMEALQMLKFTLKKACLNFTSGWITSERDMQAEDSEQDLLAALLGENHEDTLDRIIQNFSQDDSDYGSDDPNQSLLAGALYHNIFHMFYFVDVLCFCCFSVFTVYFCTCLCLAYAMISVLLGRCHIALYASSFLLLICSCSPILSICQMYD